MPLDYDGYTFDNTNAEAGYGTMTSGMYHQRLNSVMNSGYKPFGVLGQGPKQDMSLRLTDTDEERVMLAVISLFHDDIPDDDQEDLW